MLLLNTSHKMTLNAKISEAAWMVRDTRQLNVNPCVKVKQSITCLELPTMFQGDKVHRSHDNGTGWW
jgi:hypothetical protein